MRWPPTSPGTIYGHRCSARARRCPNSGVFKQWWAGGFWRSVSSSPAPAPPRGRFSPDWCAAFDRAATSGTTTPADERLLRRSSPMTVTDRITAPTLIGVGQADSLFPAGPGAGELLPDRRREPRDPGQTRLARRRPRRGVDESERLLQLTQAWMTAHLSGGPPVATDTEVTLSGGALGADSRREPALLELPQFPSPGHGGDLGRGRNPCEPRLVGHPRRSPRSPGSAVSPPNWEWCHPAKARCSESAPVTAATTLVGSGTADLGQQRRAGPRCRPVRPAAGRHGCGYRDRPRARGADPVGPHRTGTNHGARRSARRGHAHLGGRRLRLVVATTDAAYRLPDRPAIYDIGLADPVVRLPTAPEAAVVTAPLSRPCCWPPIIVVVGLLVLLLRPRALTHAAARSTPIPVVVEGLAKTYRGEPRPRSTCPFRCHPERCWACWVPTVRARPPRCA